jgi:ankyrin repeat protein
MARLTPEVLLPFLLEYPELVDTPDESERGGGLTLLHRAIKSGKTDLVLLLLLSNANPNALSIDGKNALFYGVFSNNPQDCVPVLLEFGIHKEKTIEPPKSPNL